MSWPEGVSAGGIWGMCDTHMWTLEPRDFGLSWEPAANGGKVSS